MSKIWKIFNPETHSSAWLHYLTAAFFVILVVVLFLPFFLQMLWAEKIYPSVYIDDVNLGGERIESAREKIQKRVNILETSGFEFILDANRVVIYPIITSPGDPDLTYELVAFDVDRMYQAAAWVGRRGNQLERWWAVYRSLLAPTTVSVQYKVSQESLIEILQSNFIKEETPVRNAGFVFADNELRVVADKAGRVVDYDQALVALNQRLSSLSNESITLELVVKEPEVEYKSVVSLQSQANEFLSRAPFKISVNYQDDRSRINWQKEIDKATLATWLVPAAGPQGVELAFGPQLKEFLLEQSADINRPPRDAKFEVSEGRIAQFQASQSGVRVDISASAASLQGKFLKENENQGELVLVVEESKVKTGEVNDLGINEIIGIGKSDFSGSPLNRRKNIKVASDKLNGLLIAPGEEFSLVNALKPFSQAAGYLPELVIKGSRLIPEVGGGACQIGTTTFRAALDAGLDITQRRNHSFAVSYYNDENGLPGTDATIYDPTPDFRFINNTPGYILIQTFVGDDGILTYEFWGTNDGRQASTTVPIILSRSPAPDTKYIETEDLEPGVTECTGSNVPGYKTTFKYTTLTATGEYQEEYFDSSYRPWQRVCLIGVEEVSDQTVIEQ